MAPRLIVRVLRALATGADEAAKVYGDARPELGAAFVGYGGRLVDEAASIERSLSDDRPVPHGGAAQ